MSKWKAGGSHVPQSVRKGLSYRIRMTMNRWITSENHVWDVCEEAANNIGCSPHTIWAWYVGRSLPLIHNLFAFADEFEVSLDYLAGRKAAHEIREKAA